MSRRQVLKPRQGAQGRELPIVVPERTACSAAASVSPLFRGPRLSGRSVEPVCNGRTGTGWLRLALEVVRQFEIGRTSLV